jgi:hypothetical protein
MPQLPKFEGREVAGAKIKITRAGDGLSEAMAIEPQVLKQHAKVFVVLECAVGRIAFDPVKDTNGVIRVQTLIAGTATIVDEDLVKEAIEEQRLKNEEARGEGSLNFGDGDGGVPGEPRPDDWGDDAK